MTVRMRFSKALGNRWAKVALSGGVVLLSCVSAASAQEDVWAPEIPLTRDWGSNARALGMGGAYLAISDDAGALRYNPAGLARVQRVEFSGSITNVDRSIETVFHGTPSKRSLARARVSALGFVYPFPTYRGSMVIALGYASPWPFDQEYARQGDAGDGGGGLVAEEILEEGRVGEWSFGYAVDVSPTVSLGLRTSWIQGHRFQDWVYEDDRSSAHQITDLDVSGFTGSLGAMARIGAQARLGFLVDLPRWVLMDGTVRYVLDDAEEVVDESLTLPFSAALGLAVPVNRLLMAADARFTDWTQIDYEGPVRYWYGDQRRYAYRQTWDLHLGAEYLLDALVPAGLRLRAGLAWEPVPYRILLEGMVPVGDDVEPVYYPAHFDPDRLTYTVGAGLLVQESLTVDAAYAIGSFHREGRDLSEDHTEQRFVLTAGFRLD